MQITLKELQPFFEAIYKMVDGGTIAHDKEEDLLAWGNGLLKSFKSPSSPLKKLPDRLNKIG
jgi:hypothetical protein